MRVSHIIPQTRRKAQETCLRRVEIRFDVVLSYSPTKQYSQFAVSGTLTIAKLLEEVRDLIRTLHYSYRTEEPYLNWIRHYILFHGKLHPTEMGAAEVSAFLTHLAVKRQVAASTQNRARGSSVSL